MVSAKILIVEDEGIVAKNIQNRLKRLGYVVPTIVASGEEAIRKTEETRPDLVLMDIVLKGDMDGIEAAKQIYSRFDIPIVYLTAYSDNNTLERAKLAEPFGYILKPFEIREVHSAIEMALYKHGVEKKIREKKRWLVATLKNIIDAVIISDTNGHITFINPKAEALTGWKREEALDKDLTEVFNLIDERTGNPINDLTKRVLEGEVLSFRSRMVPVSREKTKKTVYVSAAPIRDDTGGINGVVLVFREIEKKERIESNEIEIKLPESREVKDGEQDVSTSLMTVTSSAIVQGGIRKMLETEKTIEIVAEASDISEIVPLVGEKKPDILLIDAGMPKMDIQGILESIREKSPQTKVLILLRALDERFIIDSISWGVRGCLTDKSDREQFIQAIKAVRKNKIWAEVEVITRILTRLIPSKKGKPRLLKLDLTKREEDVTKLVVKGYSNKKISSKLFISEKTVKSHLRNIFKKFGVNSRFQLAIEFYNRTA